MDLKYLLNCAVEEKTEEDVKNIVSRYADHNLLKEDSSWALYNAVANKKLEMVRILLTAGPDVNVREKKGGLTPLHLAIKQNDMAIAKILLEAGANVNQVTKHNSTALHLAVESQHSDSVRLVLDYQGNVNAKKFGRSALHVAVEKRNLELAEILLRRGCSVNDSCMDGGTALHMAIEARQVEMVQLLLDNRANTSAKKFGQSALQLAVRTGCADTVRALLQRGDAEGAVEGREDEEASDRSAATELALRAKDKAVVHCLLEHAGLDPNRRASGRSMLHRAIEAGWHDTLRLLLARGAKPSHPDDRPPALHLALKLGDHEAARLLLESGAEPDALDPVSGLTPLHVALGAGSADTLGLLLEHGARPDALNLRGLTALQLAFGLGRLDLVEPLLARGANPLACRGYGKRPLEVAVQRGWLGLARRLLRAGEPPDSSGFDGASVLAHAVRSREPRMVQLLLRAGADPRGLPGSRPPPLLLAVELRCPGALLQELLCHGAPAHTVDARSGMSALQMAVAGGAEEAARLLVAGGADLDHATADGSTALLLGLDKCARRLVELLLRSGADPRLRRPGCPSPLRRAISLDWQPQVQLMLDCGAARGEPGEPAASLAEPLRYAVGKGDARMFEQLLRLGAQPLAGAAEGGRTLLHVAAAAARHCPAIVDALLARGLRLDAPDRKSPEGLTPLHCALLRGNEDTALLLLERGASVRPRERLSRRGPLHLAAETGCARVARRLLAAGRLPVDERACHGVTPLQVAAMSGQPAVAELLLGYGADPDLISGGEHFSPLHCAVCHRGYEVAEVLLAAGALGFGCACHPGPADQRAVPERSPFGYARRNVDCERIQQLLLQYERAESGGAVATLVRDEMLEYLGGLTGPTSLARVYLKHLARRGGELRPLERERLTPELLQLYDDCRAEVGRMRAERFYGQLSFGCVLERSIDGLRCLVRNDSLVRAFEDSGYQANYPLYGAILADSMGRARALEQLYVDGERLLHRLFDLPYEIGRQILQLLRIVDVRNLNRVLPAEDEAD